eukprot:3336741-Alexandrium_andersonii.AAC.1
MAEVPRLLVDGEIEVPQLPVERKELRLETFGRGGCLRLRTSGTLKLPSRRKRRAPPWRTESR